jgi:hypothetical protein
VRTIFPGLELIDVVLVHDLTILTTMPSPFSAASPLFSIKKSFVPFLRIGE